MAERNLDFSKVIERDHTNCLKYDFRVARGMPADILPLWVADMDFQISSYIQDAIEKQVRHGIYGYSEAGKDYFEAVSSWLKQQHGWVVQPQWLVKTPGVVFALAMAVKAFTNVGDGVLIQKPVYYPFSGVILDNKRKVVDNTLTLGEDGRYHIDFEDFEEKVVNENVKLFFLCNPHNPVGRVWEREELERLGDICYRHNVIVVSDEIHSDFVWKGKHQVFADLKEEYREISVTCTAPSKTFNIAGLQVSNIFIPNTRLRHQFKRQLDASGYSQLNAVGIVACEAAYRDGREWYDGVCSYIKENIEYVGKYLEENIPGVKLLKPEGTYLLWLDFRELHLSDTALEDLIIKKAGLWLDSGAIFGDAGKGFQRINAACPREILEKALNKLEEAVLSL
ncbi:MAG: pyridoxal phosphate-dependent aminotransferase [Lachnospiraceae bacterium]|nr:pyridoxal phosphate-dependent aminotransferase [Lachnospiraceae bacterium]MDY5871500.1 MalY/PatB family protein [Lachnospiraceae bacterium]